MKRLFSLILTVALIVSFSGFAFATNESQDIFAANTTESVVIDGVTYTYSYHYSSEGNRTIQITNNNTQTVETMVYDLADRVIYLDGDVWGSVTPRMRLLDASSPKYEGPNGWSYFSTIDEYISWGTAATVAAVAAAFAAVLPSIGAAGVIAAIGTGTLGAIAGMSAGGTVYADIYTFQTMLAHNYFYIWDFTASTGEFYGPYEYMMAL